MKTLILVCILFLDVCTSRLAAQWHTTSAGTTDAFYGGTFADSSTVFLSAWGDDGANVFKSTDRGAHWSTAWHDDGSYYIFGVNFLDPLTGYVAGYDPDCSCALILTTPDGGANWIPSTFSNSFGFYRVLPLDPSNILACGYNGVILRSTNGGKFWGAASTGNDSLVYRIMNFGDAKTGYAVGGAEFNFLDKIYKTTDGGATWTLQHDFNGSRSIGDVAFLDANTGFYVGSDGSDCIYKTSNGGSGWTRVYKGTDMSVFTSIIFQDKTTGYASNLAGRIVKTTDGGDHWSSVFADTSKHFDALAVAPSGSVVAATLDGSIVTGTASASVAMPMLLSQFVRVESGKLLKFFGDAALATRVVVNDILGRKVLGAETAGNDEISLASLPSGTYFWNTYHGNEMTAHGKVLIE